MIRLPDMAAQTLCLTLRCTHSSEALSLKHKYRRTCLNRILATSPPIKQDRTWPWFCTEYKISWAIISLMQSVWSPSSTLISAFTFNQSLLPADWAEDSKVNHRGYPLTSYCTWLIILSIQKIPGRLSQMRSRGIKDDSSCFETPPLCKLGSKSGNKMRRPCA